MADEQDYIVEGWKDIGKEWGLKKVTEQTVRRRARKLGMPFIRQGDPVYGRPIITKSSLTSWWFNLQEKAINSHQKAAKIE